MLDHNPRPRRGWVCVIDSLYELGRVWNEENNTPNTGDPGRETVSGVGTADLSGVPVNQDVGRLYQNERA